MAEYGNGRVCSESGSRTMCSLIGSAAPGKATTKARWRVGSGRSGGTSWCRCPVPRALPCRTRRCWGIADFVSAISCAATIGERLPLGLTCFRDLPLSLYDTCYKQAGRLCDLNLADLQEVDPSRRFGTD